MCELYGSVIKVLHIQLEKKAMRLEIKLQHLVRSNYKEDQKEIKQLHWELNKLWKTISHLSRKVN